MGAILENSIYTTPQERDAFLKEKEKVIDSLIINFFGFLGLFSLSHKRGKMKTYASEEGQVQIQNIKDDNLDPSISIKLFSDLNLIPVSTIKEMTRLLALIKQKKIKSKDLNQDAVRELVKKIKIDSHRPSPRVYKIIKDFRDGDKNIDWLAFDLYKVAKLKENKPFTGEFRKMVLSGYNLFFVDMNKTKNQPQTPNQPAIPPTTPINTPVTNTTGPSSVPSPNTNPTANPTPDGQARAKVHATTAQTPDPVIKKEGQTNNFYFDFFNNLKNKTTMDAVVNQYGITKDNFSLIHARMFLKNLFPDSPTFDQTLFNKFFGSLPNFTPSQLNDVFVRNFLKSVGMSNDEIVTFNTEFLKNYMIYAFKNIIDISDTLQEFANRLMDLRFELSQVGPDIPPHSRTNKFDNIFTNKIRDLIRKFHENILTISTKSNYKSEVFSIFNIFNTNYIDKFINSSAIFAFRNTDEIVPENAVEHFLLLGISQTMVGFSFETEPTYIQLIKKINSAASEKFVITEPNVPKVFLKKAFSETQDGKNFMTALQNLGTKYEVLTDGLNDYINIIANSLKEVAGIFNKLDSLGITIDDIKPSDYPEIAKRIDSNIDYQNPSVIQEIVAKIRYDLDDKTQRAILVNILIRSEKFMEEQSTQIIEMLFDILSEQEIEDLIDSKKTDPKFRKYLHKFLADRSFYNLGIILFRGSNKGEVIKNKILEVLINDDSLEYSHLLLQRLMPISGEDIQKRIDLLKNFIKPHHLYRVLGGINFNIAKESLKYFPADTIDRYINLIVPETNSEVLRGLTYLSDSIVTQKHEEIIADIFKNISTNDMMSYIRIIKLIIENENEKIKKIVHKRLEEADLKDFTNEGKLIFFVKFSNVDKVNEAIKNIEPKDIQTRYIGEIFSFYKENYSKVSVDTKTKIIEIALSLEERKSGLSKIRKKERDEAYTLFFETLVNEYNSGNLAEVEKVYKQSKGELKREILSKFFQFGILSSVSDSLMSARVKPNVAPTPERVPELLKYNNIHLPGISVRKTKTIADIFQSAKDILKHFEVIHINEIQSEIEASGTNWNDYLIRKSAEYDVFNKGRHGNIALQFLDEVNVRIPSQIAGFDSFVVDHPGTEIMTPVFHGTGSIAASFILRYGFAVIKENDPATVGRMLGNGIYFSTVLDKVAQYIGDAGYSRKRGEIGYIFQMKAALGNKGNNTNIPGVDYAAAGLGTDRIRSPEWCVKDPRRQVVIEKSFKSMLITRKEMDDIKKKLNINENTMVKINTFKEFIYEAKKENTNTVSFTFIDGSIPVSEEKAVDFESFDPKKFGNHVRLDISAHGPVIVFESEDIVEYEAYAVRFTNEFMRDAEKFSLYLSLLRNGRK